MNLNTKIKLNKRINNLINRFLVSFVIVMFLLVLNRYNSNFLIILKNHIFNKSFNFVRINTLSRNILGKEFIYYQKKPYSLSVINDNAILGESHKYYDGEMYHVSDNLPIGIIESGIVIFIGDKGHYKNTVIIQGVDGYNIWYGNMKDVNVKLYDYVEKNSLIGNVDGNNVYILIEKDNKIYSYEEYKNNKS